MRREILATLLISAAWLAAGIAVTYSMYRMLMHDLYPNIFQTTLPDPAQLGIVLFSGALVFTWIVIKALLPSRETQRRRLMRLLDEAGIEDVDVIQRKLNAVTDTYGAETVERAAALDSLLHEGKRKNRG